MLIIIYSVLFVINLVFSPGYVLNVPKHFAIIVFLPLSAHFDHLNARVAKEESGMINFFLLKLLMASSSKSRKEFEGKQEEMKRDKCVKSTIYQ